MKKWKSKNYYRYTFWIFYKKKIGWLSSGSLNETMLPLNEHKQISLHSLIIQISLNNFFRVYIIESLGWLMSRADNFNGIVDAEKVE